MNFMTGGLEEIEARLAARAAELNEQVSWEVEGQGTHKGLEMPKSLQIGDRVTFWVPAGQDLKVGPGDVMVVEGTLDGLEHALSVHQAIRQVDRIGLVGVIVPRGPKVLDVADMPPPPPPSGWVNYTLRAAGHPEEAWDQTRLIPGGRSFEASLPGSFRHRRGRV